MNIHLNLKKKDKLPHFIFYNLLTCILKLTIFNSEKIN
jgi:hypothetical protein